MKPVAGELRESAGYRPDVIDAAGTASRYSSDEDSESVGHKIPLFRGLIEQELLAIAE